jgi:hypothetical protein
MSANRDPDPQHIEQQPIPGHPERLTDDPDAQAPPGGGRLEDNAPTATPDTKPGTPPGSQSERDRTRSLD